MCSFATEGEHDKVDLEERNGTLAAFWVLTEAFRACQKRTPTTDGWWVLSHRGDGMAERLRKEGPFVPKPLPSNLAVNQKTQQQMSLAHHMLGRLDEAAARLPDRTVLVRSTQYREIQSMLALQGVTVATKEIAYVDLPDKPTGLKPDERVVRYLESVDEATRCVGQASVGRTLLHTANRLAQVSANAIEGEAPGADPRTGAEQWVEWVDGTKEMPLVGKVALGSYLLYTLAPFTHAADLVHVYVALELIKDGALHDQIVATSVHIDRYRAYFRHLHQKVVETGEFDEWIQFFARGIIEQCHNQLNLVDQLEQLRNRNMTLVDDRQRRDGFTRLVGSLASFQIVTAKLAAERCKITVKYARDLLKRAEGLGIVEEIEPRKRNKVYEVKEVRRLVERYAGIVPATDRDVLGIPPG